jgi:hypothetical protein
MSLPLHLEYGSIKFIGKKNAWATVIDKNESYISCPAHFFLKYDGFRIN